ncbi:MAG: hypothetical protein H6741_17850 [Alphaproteobacteria bacterium]|nr:hypothetical protein [Alphaproteobacteria bacterium]MCB9794584.1 hypothetical protein [Alphaproteobacteria bacterium]
MSRHLRLLLVLGLVSCLPGEEGIDNTVLTGTILIPPSEAISEGSDRGAQAQDTYLASINLGELSWRWEQRTGDLKTFESTPDRDGVLRDRDRDWITFSAPVAGDYTVRFLFTPVPGEPSDSADTGAPAGPMPDTGDSGGGDTGGDSGAEDSGDTALDTGFDTGGAEPACEYDNSDDDVATTDLLVYRLTAWTLNGEDPACETPALDTNTDGSDGVLEYSFALEAGEELAFRISGITGDLNIDSTWLVQISGGPPEAGGIKVGAYAPFPETDPETETEVDFYNRGTPYGGGSAYDWSFDADTLTWTGSFRMLKFRSVESGEGENDYCDLPEDDPLYANCAPQDQHTVVEGVDTVWIAAGDFASLNSALPAGTLYNSVPVEVTLDPDADNVLAEPVVMDEIAPLVVGWEVDEVEPNDVVTLNPDGYPTVELADLANAQVLEVGSGFGFVDIIHGTLEGLTTGIGWEGPTDYFAMSVDEPLYVTATLTWSDSAGNLDLLLMDSAAEAVVGGWLWSDTSPEYFVLSEVDYLLEPGEVYYLAVLPWDGADGDYNYQIQLEWAQP